MRLLIIVIISIIVFILFNVIPPMCEDRWKRFLNRKKSKADTPREPRA